MFTLPNLPYEYDALEPVISQKIMELHHNKHHATYVVKLNDAVKGTKFESMQIEDILKSIDQVPQNIKQAVINHGGGHANHSLFWTFMRAPKTDNRPTENVLRVVNTSFGSFDSFKEQFSNNALTRFGSGWSWLVKKPDSTLALYSTANQDSPYLQGDKPILGLDVWEHAYYLDYFSDRAKYVSEWWKVVNWEEVEKKISNQ